MVKVEPVSPVNPLGENVRLFLHVRFTEYYEYVLSVCCTYSACGV